MWNNRSILYKLPKFSQIFPMKTSMASWHRMAPHGVMARLAKPMALAALHPTAHDRLGAGGVLIFSQQQTLGITGQWEFQDPKMEVR